MTPLHQYLVALGSNMGDRKAHVDRALAALREGGLGIHAISPLYETTPVGEADLPFLNGALIGETAKRPESMLNDLLSIERELGRTRTVRWGNRTIDLDIVLWRCQEPDGSWRCQSYSTEGLEIPHPRMLERPFVTVPAADVAGSWIHPVSGRSVEEERHRRGHSL